ncbi:MAG: ATP-binding protein [Terrimicrobiaceae bacterium]|nr:ATP-binding protein [Terrimicrobiaceae bacterium]
MTELPDDPFAECGQEPIHVPGTIQPHGILIVFDSNGICHHFSANAEELTGQPPAALAGRPLQEFIPVQQFPMRQAGVDPTMQSPFSVDISGRPLDAWLHQSANWWVVELEPRIGPDDRRLHRRVAAAVTGLRDAPDFPTQHLRTARFVAELTGFDRVMVYEFGPDWHGEVVGEHRNVAVESYLGHHFPASDIPAQARALYARNRLRLIPDVDYEPVPIVPEMPTPIDLSQSVLRSVSPVHLEYLRNMGVGASMSISLIVNGRLWGLVACHHRTPKVVPAGIRAACEAFGEAVSLEIAHRQETRTLRLRATAGRIQTRFFDVLAREHNVVDALVRYTPRLLEFLGAGGTALRLNGTTTLHGATPSPAQVEALFDWLQVQEVNPIFSTDRLAEVYPPAADYGSKASGLLALKLSRVEPHYVLWFRPEVLATVTWAGKLEKPRRSDGRLHPRKSFDAWSERVHGRSQPWTEAEHTGALELLQAINALVLRRTEHLLSENAELERKNIDLHSFAYIAAHDLKEPLRGISHYCAFLREDHAADLNEEAVRKLDTIDGLVRHSEELIEALNHYSRIGRIELSRQPVEMNKIVDQIIETLSITNPDVEFRRSDCLPNVDADRVLMREVFLNLLTNAARYNISSPKRVEIGWTPEHGGTFFVRDNGIGIPAKHYESVFRIFRRLHGNTEFGGGTGAGLAIVKSIIERHGGRIWLESEPGVGSTFFFTLA